MSNELTVLALAGLLAAVQFVVMGIPLNAQLGPDWTLGPRDVPRTPSGIGGRLYRAFNNHMEGLVLFTLAVVVVELSGSGTRFTSTCAWVYLVARVLYVPAYAAGLVPWRSIIWSFGFLATVAMILAALL